MLLNLVLSLAFPVSSKCISFSMPFGQLIDIFFLYLGLHIRLPWMNFEVCRNVPFMKELKSDSDSEEADKDNYVIFPV